MSYFTFIADFFFFPIGSFGYVGTVQPHDDFTFVISKGTFPVFLKINSQVPSPIKVIFPKSYSVPSLNVISDDFLFPVCEQPIEVKRNITVIRVPWNYNFLEEKADGIILSNGPGDPKKCRETIELIKKAFAKNIPIMGICLGSQILGLAAGANTFKLKYGHRSQNQPCIEMGTNRCYITSQNHGYAVDSSTLPQDWREWFYNNNDETNEGIVHISRPFFGVQFHPEASPGPDDTEFIFDMFLRAMK